MLTSSFIPLEKQDCKGRLAPCRGCRGVPCFIYSPLAPPAAARKKKKKEVFGDTPFGVNLRGAGASLLGFGVSPSFFSPSSSPTAASKRGKRGFSGTPRTPAKGGCPLQSHLKIVKLTPKGDTPHPGRDAALPAPSLLRIFETKIRDDSCLVIF
jgi:hypothetical protein